MQTCTSSNLQTPSSKEIPESKHQKPSSKHQRSSKLQVPSSKRRPRFGAWNLGFLWCFELARTFHTGAVFCGKRCHDAAAASGVAQICNLPYRRFSIGRVFSVARRPRHCRRPAEYNSAIQQIENLRYEYEISRLGARRRGCYCGRDGRTPDNPLYATGAEETSVPDTTPGV